MVNIFCNGVVKGGSISTEFPTGVDGAIIKESPLLPVPLGSIDNKGEAYVATKFVVLKLISSRNPSPTVSMSFPGPVVTKL